ncbi:hypothetical protein [Enterococcus sp. DIV0800]|uniref:hypothetical protein n=1 Tax=unclassified Enterococcus TaxID=2608891 RepID=UPI003D300FBF
MTELAIKNIVTEYVTLDILQIENRQVTLKYHTLKINNPSENENFIGLWRTSDGTVPAQAATWSESVKKSEPEASVSYKMPLTDAAYIIGFCPNGDPKTKEQAWKNVAATVLLDPSKDQANGQNETIKLDIKGSDTDTIRLEYQLINGMVNSRHWIGIWEKEGNTVNFASDPEYKAIVSEEDPRIGGQIDLSDATFYRGTTYVLGYFFDYGSKDKEYSRKHLVGTITFTT